MKIPVRKISWWLASCLPVAGAIMVMFYLADLTTWKAMVIYVVCAIAGRTSEAIQNNGDD